MFWTGLVPSGSKLRRALQKLGLTMVVAAGLAAGGAVMARTAEPPRTEATVALAALFPYEKDGAVFGNRERNLPRMARGYYREYTVKTPGARTRGAKRIVCGGKPPTQPDTCFYTDDHYASFRRIEP